MTVQYIIGDKVDPSKEEKLVQAMLAQMRRDTVRIFGRILGIPTHQTITPQPIQEPQPAPVVPTSQVVTKTPKKRVNRRLFDF